VAAVAATFNIVFVFLPSHLATTGRAPLPRALAAALVGLSLTYGLASALFGGTAPALATFLVRRTGDALAPAWYATGLTVVAIACVLAAPETAGRPLDAGVDRASELRR
jgi:MFS transporter, MHS family, proline/betaine transporter